MKIQILLPLVTYPDADTDEVAANAAAIAAHLGAELNALALNVHIPPMSSPLSRVVIDLPEMSREAESHSRERGKHLLARVVEEAGKRGVPVSTSSLAAGPAMLGEVAGQHARYFDLALLGWAAGNPTARMAAEAVVFGSGRPTILLPALTSIGRIDNVAVAWDGSRVAARAVGDALPFLERASQIHVLTVTDEKPIKHDDIGERLATSLRRHGLAAKWHAITAEDCPIGITLQEHAIKAGAELLVMGGYGHSRLREFVLGGATAGVLDDLRLPILLSH
jgi:nucleotide-binding universal stress UspA family protein